MELFAIMMLGCAMMNSVMIYQAVQHVKQLLILGMDLLGSVLIKQLEQAAGFQEMFVQRKFVMVQEVV